MNPAPPSAVHQCGSCARPLTVDSPPCDCRKPTRAPHIAEGDRVVVWPGPGRGLDYPAIVEKVKGDRATVRPVGPALSQPAWANSRRARSVKLTSLEKATRKDRERFAYASGSRAHDEFL